MNKQKFNQASWNYPEETEILVIGKPNKQKIDWESIKNLLLCEKYIYYCDLNNEDLDKLSKLISKLLKTQREEIVSEIKSCIVEGSEDVDWEKLKILEKK